MNIQEITQSLTAPFDTKDLEFRIARVFKNNSGAVVLTYITARAIMDRLDSVLGIDGWYDDYTVIEKGIVCSLTVLINDVWITKQDTAPFTNIEALKGGFSDALKRAAVKFGIGRYLYNLPEYVVELHQKAPYNVDKNRVHRYSSREISAYWVEPELPSWAIASSSPTLENQGNPAEDNRLGKPDEQDVPVNDYHTQNSQSSGNQAEQLRSNLIEYVGSLYSQNALTEKRRNEYLEKLSQSNINIGFLKYFEHQFQTIDLLYNLYNKNAINDDERKDYYREIITANNKKLYEIENNLKQRAA